MYFAYAKTKTQIRFGLTAKLINAFVFATVIVQQLLPKCEISSSYSYLVIAQPRLCHTWSKTPKTGFVMMRLI